VLTMARKTIACIDIGRTKTSIALAEIDGFVIDIIELPTQLELGPFQILEEIVNKLDTMFQETKSTPMILGVCCPGPLDIERGLVLSPPNLPGWTDFPLVELIHRRFEVPVVFDNDANAAALGEYKFGVGRGIDNLVYVTVSTGIGGGIIVNGQLIQGVGVGAGEIGHITVLPDGPLCGCGARGCLNAISSGNAIATNARQRLIEGNASILKSMVTDLENITAQIVAEAAIRGDLVARQVWDEAVYYLAVGIGNVVVTLSPEAVVIGGGVSASNDLLLTPLRRLILERTKILPVERIAILQAGLGANSGIYGALAMAAEKLGSSDG
jgi:glucokinase